MVYIWGSYSQKIKNRPLFFCASVERNAAVVEKELSLGESDGQNCPQNNFFKNTSRQPMDTKFGIPTQGVDFDF
jgi:hypothetical protein